MTNADMPEAEELERAAEWRLRLHDADSDDAASEAAAAQLSKLSEDLRPMPGSSLLDEYRCICNWLSESDDLSDLSQTVHDYNVAIGFGVWAETGEDYLRALIDIAHRTFGKP